MKNVQVLQIVKRIKISSGLNRHITRAQWFARKLVVWTPDNADPALTGSNVELISRVERDNDGKARILSLQEAVSRRIAAAGIKPRKGQSSCLEIIFSGSHEVMANMTREQLLNWARDTISWAQKMWGKDNVVSATLHVDERTPHIHMIVVPIVQGESRRTKSYKKRNSQHSRAYNIDHNRNRLCVNEVYTSQKLYEYHDDYAKNVSNKYGLQRGVKAEPGCHKKHQTSEEYNRKLAQEAIQYEERNQQLKLSIKQNTSIIEGQIDFVSELKKRNEVLDRQIDDKLAKFSSLTAYGLVRFINFSSDLVASEVNRMVQQHFPGQVSSIGETRKMNEGKIKDFITIEMSNGGKYYTLDVRAEDGHIWYNNQPYLKTTPNGVPISMMNVAEYISRDLHPEIKDYFFEQYKLPNPKRIVAWTCHLGAELSRIVRDENIRLYDLQIRKWNSPDADHVTPFVRWETRAQFYSFRVIKQEDKEIILEIKRWEFDDKGEYINHRGDIVDFAGRQAQTRDRREVPKEEPVDKLRQIKMDPRKLGR